MMPKFAKNVAMKKPGGKVTAGKSMIGPREKTAPVPAGAKRASKFPLKRGY